LALQGFPAALGYAPGTIVALVVILALSAVMSGLSGFGFSAIGAFVLWLMPPRVAVPLLMSLSAANQLMSLGQLKADLKPLREWWPQGPAPYLLGGLIGVPFGLAILRDLPAVGLTAAFGAFLLLYALYSMFKPAGLHVRPAGSWVAPSLVGMAGGVIGGFTAFPGATVVIWSGLRGLSKTESRSIVQPFILGLQVVALAMLAVQSPGTFNAGFWAMLLLTIPVVLPGTLLGVNLYKSLSEVNFRRITFILLAISGASLLMKASGFLGGGAHHH
jgi:uncharacterized membrane protein YfcA